MNLAAILTLSFLFSLPTFMATATEIPMSTFSFAEASEKLKSMGEEQLLANWSKLTFKQQQALLREIEALDPLIFEKQQRDLQTFLQAAPEVRQKEWKAFDKFNISGTEAHRSLGKSLMKQGKVGCLIVAGGQGTRLSYDAPKGTFPVSVIKHKTLFQIFAEKTIAASKQAGRLLPLAIMTSPQNDAATKDFFQKHNFFNLAKEQLFFFTQRELPFLDDQGHLMLKKDASIAKGPDGNGGSLEEFVKSGIWDVWKKQGIEYINYILIDNPLADPFDAELVGYHASNGCEITLKCVEKFIPEERVGLVVENDDGSAAVVEYSEMESSERMAVLPDGKLKHRCTNISLFCFSMDFIKQTAATTNLPWHFAHKAAYFNGPLGWKFETFIFDLMGSAQVVKALLYPRHECFAPLKNGSGSDSLETVQEALLKQDFKVLEAICGHSIPFSIIELDQHFHYPTEELLDRWKNFKGPLQGYISQDYQTSEQ